MVKEDTFSFKVKSELLKNIDDYKVLEVSEILGMIFINKKTTDDEITFVTESKIVCEYISKVLSEKLNIIVDIKEKVSFKKKVYILSIPCLNDRIKIIKILKSKYDYNSINFKANFLRGAFMTFGTIIDPLIDYHLEFILWSEDLAKWFQNFIKSVKNINVNPKLIKRRNSYIIYIKGSEEIINLLTFVGATSCSMELMQIKMLKELRNNVNRTTNFETANISKIAKVSATQIEKINKIKNTVGLDKLPEELKILAVLRLEHPEMSLKDLGENITPKLSRSGVYHRMQRIMKFKV